MKGSMRFLVATLASFLLAGQSDNVQWVTGENAVYRCVGGSCENWEGEVPSDVEDTRVKKTLDDSAAAEARRKFLKFKADSQGVQADTEPEPEPQQDRPDDADVAAAAAEARRRFLAFKGNGSGVPPVDRPAESSKPTDQASEPQVDGAEARLRFLRFKSNARPEPSSRDPPYVEDYAKANPAQVGKAAQRIRDTFDLNTGLGRGEVDGARTCNAQGQCGSPPTSTDGRPAKYLVVLARGNQGKAMMEFVRENPDTLRKYKLVPSGGTVAILKHIIGDTPGQYPAVLDQDIDKAAAEAASMVNAGQVGAVIYFGSDGGALEQAANSGDILGAYNRATAGAVVRLLKAGGADSSLIPSFS